MLCFSVQQDKNARRKQQSHKRIDRIYEMEKVRGGIAVTVLIALSDRCPSKTQVPPLSKRPHGRFEFSRFRVAEKKRHLVRQDTVTLLFNTVFLVRKIAELTESIVETLVGEVKRLGSKAEELEGQTTQQGEVIAKLTKQQEELLAMLTAPIEQLMVEMKRNSSSEPRQRMSSFTSCSCI
eukprot:g68177.t1